MQILSKILSKYRWECKSLSLSPPYEHYSWKQSFQSVAKYILCKLVSNWIEHTSYIQLRKCTMSEEITPVKSGYQNGKYGNYPLI